MPMYTPLTVTPGKQWNNEHGNYQPYILKLEGVEKAVHLNTKVGSPAPTVGAPLDMELLPHPQFDDALKGKKAFNGSGGGGRARSPEENARIMRQHSQEMALRYTAIKGKSDFGLDELRKVIDWFDTDAKAAKP